MNTNDHIGIHMAFPGSPIFNVLKRIIDTPDRLLVTNQERADLILFTDFHQIEGDFNRRKFYLFLNLEPTNSNIPKLPKNVRTITRITLIEIVSAIEEVQHFFDTAVKWS